MNIILSRRTKCGGKILEAGTILDLPETTARKLIARGIVSPMSAPPPPASPKYHAGDRVRYCLQSALNIKSGTIIEIQIFSFGNWYLVDGGIWISENHIQG